MEDRLLYSRYEFTHWYQERNAKAYVPDSSVCTYDFRTNANHSRLYEFKVTAKRNREVAKKMKAEGISAEVIAKCTGLTAKEVEAL